MQIAKVLTLLMMVLVMMGASNCSGIKYESDEGMMAPYQAEVFEYPVTINGAVCRDMKGSVGACTLITDERKDIKISIMKKQYNYNIRVVCSSSIGFEFDQDIPKDKAKTVTIPKSYYQNVSNFICIGRATPLNRNFVSARFEVRVRVQNGQYVSRGNGVYDRSGRKRTLNMGRHARYLHVYDRGKWKEYSKDPVVRVRDKASKVRAYSESYLMRFNYYNW